MISHMFKVPKWGGENEGIRVVTKLDYLLCEFTTTPHINCDGFVRPAEYLIKAPAKYVNVFLSP